ncbi:TonB-system energizer ExbB [Wolinella succinogenes]|uniref:BIOPOLYMER TRANSPORT EXBB PROTEIN n=1 Tax=Wolinella succinogenes (strain ATCC 29543 / DSM 1740 / CCUG 13145 / JCM 31913 / LMG 7466 / NCTC 11488 / FDC 602W) TaxID=273121 RepID=Q7M8T3_WOLSU|nr:TonB-system energizer ExbB [Wolinella succinogenes]NLU34803.1 TonB-system energizer ExbB [Wolinella succinogenes]CAE10490.1 BIOPOLYMER TRANSPORT EXBB PROTEIN [Wolinella succinogenes]VEG80634.1 colicin uptake protein TolQ [Wolinella succinogenes]HCZ19671.1 TonB-system energizer ExbB [Helicobacter sp.]
MHLIKAYMDHAIFGILGFMSLLALAYAIERFLYYKNIKVDRYKDVNQLENDLTQNLTILSIIGSNAPYIGLLGTVIGIMVTFYDMGSGAGIDTNAVLIGLSLALKATALGLLVAIPTLIVYTACLRKVDVHIAAWKSLDHAA